MPDSKRVFILGAGFSHPAQMPLATELLPLLIDYLKLKEMREWLADLCERLTWLSGKNPQHDSFALNIEQVFHYAHFDREVYRLQQHLAPGGRRDGPGTPWSQAERIEAWLQYLEDALCDVILKRDNQADLEPIRRWARAVSPLDAALTFNYDTLAERALDATEIAWNHGLMDQGAGVPVYKLHGSIDWIVADRAEEFRGLDPLFDKPSANRLGSRTGHVEDDYRLCRCRTRKQLESWLAGRDLQTNPSGTCPRTVGIAGLGAYKELHQIPGLGHVWACGTRALYQADCAVVVGFSMSDFDAMAQMQFSAVARERWCQGRPLPVVVVDPFADEAVKHRFRTVFRCVHFIEEPHEVVDWSRLG